MQITLHAACCAALLILGCGPRAQQDAVDLPVVPREFRAAWVATVANIDWPSKPGLPVKRQQEEALAILDRLVELNMNCVVFQVRPHADAMYASDLEPWSYYLTGEQGRAPKPFYDPLEFWVEEAHARGLELHAWFNPYRAGHPAQKGGYSKGSVVRSQPELVRELGSKGYWWMDPAMREVQQHSLRVVFDVVERYAIDGVHFDDYFYPYTSYNDGKDFPDDVTWKAYRDGGGELSRADWRRAAVDGFIAELYSGLKERAPHVEFGVSPFGIWRPGYPAGIAGLDQYDVLYADARKWLLEGQLDYFMPQLYWPIAQRPQSFPVLLGWWQDQNPLGRHVWPGTSIARMSGQGAAGRTELLNQIQIVRGMQRGGPGLCLFSMKWLMGEDSSLAKALLEGPWQRPALIPASPWLDEKAPRAPQLKLGRKRGKVRELRVTSRDDDVFQFVVWELRGERWSWRLVSAAQLGEAPLQLTDGVTRVAVAAVDRCRNLGEPAMLDVD